MKYHKIFLTGLVFGIVLLSLITDCKSQPPYYIGLKENDEYVWTFDFNNTVYEECSPEFKNFVIYARIFASYHSIKSTILKISDEVYHQTNLINIFYKIETSSDEEGWQVLYQGDTFIMNPLSYYDQDYFRIDICFYPCVFLPASLNWSMLYFGIDTYLADCFNFSSPYILIEERGTSLYFYDHSGVYRIMIAYKDTGILYEYQIYHNNVKKVASMKLTENSASPDKASKIPIPDISIITLIGIFIIYIRNIMKRPKKNNKLLSFPIKSN